jgi:hypothetical protein
MADHDQRFKSLLKAFFAEFFQVFFPAWADRFDFARVDWLEQEVFTDPPRGEPLTRHRRKNWGRCFGPTVIRGPKPWR